MIGHQDQNAQWIESLLICLEVQTSQSTRTLTPPNQFNINSGGTMTFWPLGSLQQGGSLQVPVVHIIWWCHERKVIFYRLPRPINTLPKSGYIFVCTFWQYHLLVEKIVSFFLGLQNSFPSIQLIETCYACRIHLCTSFFGWMKFLANNYLALYANEELFIGNASN